MVDASCTRGDGGTNLGRLRRRGEQGRAAWNVTAGVVSAVYGSCMCAGVTAVQVFEAEVYVGDGVPEGDDRVRATVAVVVPVGLGQELYTGGTVPGSASPTRVLSESGWNGAA